MMAESVQRPLLHLSRLQKWRLLSALFFVYRRMILMRKNTPSAIWTDESTTEALSIFFRSIIGLNLVKVEEVTGVYFYHNSHGHE